MVYKIRIVFFFQNFIRNHSEKLWQFKKNSKIQNSKKKLKIKKKEKKEKYFFRKIWTSNELDPEVFLI